MDPELILKEQDLNEFWTEYSTELSKKLLLPQKIDSPVLDSNYLKTYLLHSMPNSSFSILKNIKLKTCCRLLRFLQPEIKTKITRKIRIYPTHEQKIFFNKCFGFTRYIYNKTIDKSNKNYKYCLLKLVA